MGVRRGEEHRLRVFENRVLRNGISKTDSVPYIVFKRRKNLAVFW
jgi:hypothetical protein